MAEIGTKHLFSPGPAGLYVCLLTSSKDQSLFAGYCQ